MYNKRQFNKANDKKVLHKVRKQWVTVSIALLALIGGGALANRVSASANETNSNNNDNNNSINQNNTTNSNRQVKLITPQQTPQANIQTGQNNNSLQGIQQNAKQIHNNILTHAMMQNNDSNVASYKLSNANQPMTVASSSASLQAQSSSDFDSASDLHGSSYRAINNLDSLSTNQVGKYGHYLFGRFSTPFSDLNINKNIMLHTGVYSNEDNPQSSLASGATAHIIKAFKQYGYKGTYIRYLIDNDHNNYYITGNPNFVSFSAPSTDYHYYQNMIDNLLVDNNSQGLSNFKQEVNELNNNHDTNYKDYMNLYINAYKFQQDLMHPAIANPQSLATSEFINELETPANGGYNSASLASASASASLSNRSNASRAASINASASISNSINNSKFASLSASISASVSSVNSESNSLSAYSAASRSNIAPSEINTIRTDITSVSSYDQEAINDDNSADTDLNSLNVSSDVNLSSMKNNDIDEVDNDRHLVSDLSNENNGIVNYLDNINSNSANLNIETNSANAQVSTASKVASDAKDIIYDDVDTLESEAKNHGNTPITPKSNMENSLISSTQSKMALMANSANSIANHNHQASSLYKAFQTYSNSVNLDINSYNNNNSLTKSYLSNADKEKSLASSENTVYKSASNSTNAKSLANTLLNEISSADNDAKLASSTASVANSYGNQEMSNFSYANSEYLAMQKPLTVQSNTNAQTISTAPSSTLMMTDPSTVGQTNSKEVNASAPSVSTSNNGNVEQAYHNAVSEYYDIIHHMLANNLIQYNHNDNIYNKLFGGLPSSSLSNLTPQQKQEYKNKQLVLLHSTPQVPSQTKPYFEYDNNNSDNPLNKKDILNHDISGLDTEEAGEVSDLPSNYQPYTLYADGTLAFTTDKNGNGQYNGGWFTPEFMNGWPGEPNSDNAPSDAPSDSDSSDNTPSDDTPSDNTSSDNDDSDVNSYGSRYDNDVRDMTITNGFRIHGATSSDFRDMHNLRFVHFYGSKWYSDCDTLVDEFSDDNNLQSVQFDPSMKNIQGGIKENVDGLSLPHQNSDVWEDASTGDKDIYDIFNGDTWINTDNLPNLHAFSVPVKVNINNSGNTTTKQEYITMNGSLNDSVLINLNKICLPGYTTQNTHNVSVATHIDNNGYFYYTDNGDSTNWINTNANGKNPTLVINVVPNNLGPTSNGNNNVPNKPSSNNKKSASSSASSSNMSSEISTIKKDIASVSAYDKNIINDDNSANTDLDSLNVSSNASLNSQKNSYINDITGYNNVVNSLNNSDNNLLNRLTSQFNLGSEANDANSQVNSASVIASNANNILNNDVSSLSSKAKSHSNTPAKHNSNKSNAVNNTIKEIADTTFNDINKERKVNGLAPLNVNNDLNKIANDRANQLINKFSHYNSKSQVYANVDAQQIAPQFVNTIGENIASGSLSNDYVAYDSGSGINDKGKKDPNHYVNHNGHDIANMLNDEMMNWDADQHNGHRDNILDSSYKTIGIGVSYDPKSQSYYLAENFSYLSSKL